MRFHIMIRNHMGSTSPLHLCTACARKSPYPPLRSPGDGSLDPATGRQLAGKPVSYEHPWLSCSNCGESDARTGFLRLCASCNRNYLLDHEEKEWPPPPWFCPRPPCKSAERKSAR